MRKGFAGIAIRHARMPSDAASRISIHSCGSGRTAAPILYLRSTTIYLTGDRTLTKPIKHVEKAIAVGANAAWFVFDKLNSIKPQPCPSRPKWSDKPLLKSWEKQKPKLGWPRETDSLCPNCVPEIRKQILDGKLPVEILKNEKVGEIKAQIIERDGKILMVKDCPIHGHFEDVMSIDPAFFKHLEDVFPGRDIRAHNDEKLHDHGTSTITHGRGIGPDHRSDQPLQHDVRSVFHGRQPGRLRA